MCKFQRVIRSKTENNKLMRLISKPRDKSATVETISEEVLFIVVISQIV